ncbi:FXSXX-COOH protein [Streptomyces sp. NPDC058195]|uniref:FXSXX-COOH protein n=1 Tax=Streptomyces sp. NPDC058195 TaxID=3346375 RepID=UPI0036EE7848
MKTSESSVSFAAAKKSTVPLSRIDLGTAEATRKLDRVFTTSAGRHSQASTFSSAL